MADIKGREIKVHEHGFVRVVDTMGDDAAIVQAARVSYGEGTKTVNEDAGLLNYLMKHKHSSPFEMCLSGGTRVPTAPCAGAAVKFYTMKQLADAFAEGGKRNAWVKLVNIRTVNPSTGVVTATKIKRAWKTGERAVYRVTTSAPVKRSVVLTANHPILTPEGFKSLDEGLAAGDVVMANGIPALQDDVVSEIKRRRAAGQPLTTVASALGVSASVVYKYAGGRVPRMTGFLKKPTGAHVDPRSIARRRKALGVCEAIGCGAPATDRHHIDEDPHNNALDNLSALCAKHHRHVHTMSVLEKAVQTTIESVEYVGVEDVYDLEVWDDNHTFVAEGVVVHNCEIKMHVKLPIFVARQWIRHRTANVNEVSGRYSVLPSEFYTPDTWHTQAKDNKQGSGEALDAEAQGHVTDAYTMAVEDVFEWYESTVAKDDRPYMVAREQARIVLPLSTYTEWYWKIDLSNLLHFLRLRSDPHAQAEIRAYADVIGGLVQKWVPLSWEAFEEYVLHARTLSRAQLVVLNDMLALLEGNNVDTVAGLLEEVERDKILDKREAKEMKEIFGV
jgi:thymidylate synthase (FAD)